MIKVGDGAVAGCEFSLVEYKNGVITEITEKVMSSVGYNKPAIGSSANSR